MNHFLSDGFLLHSAQARALYAECRDLPIFDYHSHLSPQELYENKPYASLAELWLAHDHYKWRAMRLAGIDERYSTGDAPDEEKLVAFAGVLDSLVGCPLYAWAQMEIATLFGEEEPLQRENARQIGARCAKKLQTEPFTPRALLRRFRVRALATTDAPFDSLAWHELLAREEPSFRVLPTFRPDALLTAKSPAWRGAVDALAKSEGIPIRSLGDCERALLHSLDRFVRAGCRMSDHGFEHLRYTDPAGAEAAFSRAMAGAVLTEREAASLSSHLLRFLGGAYADRGLTMQLHVGAVRNGSTRLFRQLGADAGGDSADDPGAMRGLLPLLDSLDCAGRLPKIILYCLNECDYPACVTMAASFRKPGVVNPVQLGAAWWFNDTERGIRKQLTLLMENAMLPGFCGMLTDSRSLTSFVRHDYFRRILCDLVGGELENGNFVNLDAAKRLIRNVCCANPAACLGMDAGEGAG